VFLQLDLATILFEIANFLILASLLYRFLFRPFMARVRERAEEKERLLQEAEEDRREADRLRQEAEQRLEGLSDSLSEMLQKARAEIDVERQKVLDDVREEAQQLLRRAREEAREVQRQQKQQYEEAMLESSISVARRLIAEAAPLDVHRRMVEELIREVWEMGSEQMERVDAVRRSLGDRTLTAQVSTAKPLPPDLQRELVQAFSAVADRTISFNIEIDPDLAAGVRVRMGDLLVEHSISQQLAQLRDQAAEALSEIHND
jgi:F-type H+-transporting ATPase subunit b